MSDTFIELGALNSSKECISPDISPGETLRELREQSLPKGTFDDFLKKKGVEITLQNKLFIKQMFRHLKDSYSSAKDDFLIVFYGTFQESILDKEKIKLLVYLNEYVQIV
jgi:hypothetical protein